MRLGRLPQNSFDRLMSKAIKPAGQNINRMKAPGGASTICENQEITVIASVQSRLDDISRDMEKSFYKAYAEVCCAGGKPKQLLINLSVKRRDSESKVKEMLQAAERLCIDNGMIFIPTAIDTLGDMRVASLTVLGEMSVEMEQSKPKSGDYVCVAGYVGSSGALDIIRKCRDRLSNRFSAYWLERAEDNLKTNVASILTELKKSDMLTAYPIAEGGILAALWDMKSSCGFGFNISQLDIPIRQETVEICEYMGMNPYQLSGEGAFLVICHEPEKLQEKMWNAGISFEILGKLTEDKACILNKKEEMTCLDRPEQDEIWQLFINEKEGGNNT